MNRFFTTLICASISTYSFSQAPATYYSFASGKTCAELKTALKQITDDVTGSFSGDVNTSVTRTYDELKGQYKLTDIKPREVGSGSAEVIWDIYSDKPGSNNDPYNFTPGDECGNYSKEGDCYNREHSFPQSWFKEASPMKSDYLHIYPTDGSVNGKRSNFKFGVVANTTYTSQNGSKLGSSAVAGVSGTVFEPIDEYKGDLARTYLYMVTRYEDKIATWKGYGTAGSETLDGKTYPGVDKAYLALMVLWHNQDPVSQKELDRNNGAYSFQQNRNPFVDHPEYVGLIWGTSCLTLPVDFVLFKGLLTGEKITLDWKVANEQNLQKYVVERSLNGTSFTAVGEVAASNKGQYQLTDNVSQMTGRRLYYRVRQVDVDGKIKYSEVFTVHVPLNNLFSIYPNPAKNYMVLQLSHPLTHASISVVDMEGRTRLSQVVNQATGTLKIPVNLLASGTYIVKIFQDGQSHQAKLQVVR